MPNFSLLGPTPGAAAGQQAQWAGYYTGQNNQNEQNRIQAILTSMRAQEAQDRADEYSRQFDVGQSVNNLRNSQILERQAAMDAENTRRFNLGRADDLQRETDARLWKGRVEYLLALSQIKRNEAYEPTAKTQEQIYTDKVIQDMADRGEIDNPVHARKLAPTLSPAFAELLASRSANVRRDVESQYDQLVAAAHIATEHEQARRALAAATALPDVSDFWHAGTPGTDRKNAIKSAADKVASLQEAFTRISNPKTGFMQLLTQNADGSYTPAIAAPAWRRAETARTATATQAPVVPRLPAQSTASPEPAPAPNASMWKLLGAQMFSPSGVAGAYPESPTTQTATVPTNQPAPVNPSDRVIDQVYVTPAGLKRWRGNGWSNP